MGNYILVHKYNELYAPDWMPKRKCKLNRGGTNPIEKTCFTCKFGGLLPGKEPCCYCLFQSRWKEDTT